jgi:hypothetical protein
VRFEIERRALNNEDWEAVGKTDGIGDRAALAAVEGIGETAGIYRARPADGEEAWMYAYLDPKGRAERREGVA